MGLGPGSTATVELQPRCPSGKHAKCAARAPGRTADGYDAAPRDRARLRYSVTRWTPSCAAICRADRRGPESAEAGGLSSAGGVAEALVFATAARYAALPTRRVRASA